MAHRPTWRWTPCPSCRQSRRLRRLRSWRTQGLNTHSSGRPTRLPPRSPRPLGSRATSRTPSPPTVALPLAPWASARQARTPSPSRGDRHRLCLAPAFQSLALSRTGAPGVFTSERPFDFPLYQAPSQNLGDCSTASFVTSGTLHAYVEWVNTSSTSWNATHQALVRNFLS